MRLDWWRFGLLSFIAMEYCEGGSLVDWIQRKKQARRTSKPEEVALIGAQIVSALSYCHQRKILHLDLKPANVFVKADQITVSFHLHFLNK